MAKTGDIQAELFDRHVQWVDAWTRPPEPDTAALEEIIDPHAVFTSHDGSRSSRGDKLNLLASAVPIEHDVTMFRVLSFRPDTAIVWLDHTLRIDAPRKFVENADMILRLRDGVLFTVTGIWHRFEGQWRLISQDGHLVEKGYLPRARRTQKDLLQFPKSTSA